jgi:uncharacterized membrane protein YbhN (UPF0104 family)
LSWIAGTLTPGAPAGLGTREFVMSKLLSDAYPEAKVLNMVLTLRVVSILGDMAVFFIGLQLARHTSGNVAQGTNFKKKM